MWLIKNNVPLDVAFSLEYEDRIAWCIIFGQFEGQKFNFETMKFEKPGNEF